MAGLNFFKDVNVMLIIPDINILSNQVKQHSSIEEQIRTLRSRNLLISDDILAEDILLKTNYYYFTGYLHDFKDQHGNYETDLTFEDVYEIIKFDISLRKIFMFAIDYIERDTKTKIAYFMSKHYTYGNVAYLYHSEFPNKETEHRKFISHFERAFNENSKLPFVEHHIHTYGKCLPIWVAVEILTLGNIENLYLILRTDVKDKIASTYGYSITKIESWLKATRIFRNMLAHNARLYNAKIWYEPKKTDEYSHSSHLIFDYIVVLKNMFPFQDIWNNEIRDSLSNLFESWGKHVDISCWGFPNDWETILTK